ncbi:MAG TPA: hypothetical protein VF195_13900 [Actinomycetota bacterium]
MTGRVTLRGVTGADLPIFFAHQRDEERPHSAHRRRAQRRIDPRPREVLVRSSPSIGVEIAGEPVTEMLFRREGPYDSATIA